MKPRFSKRELLRRCSKIKLVSLDTDGVLTDGGIYVDDAGNQQRKFNVKDGVGIRLLLEAGIEVTIITASSTNSIKHRAKMLNIKYFYLGVEDKLACLESLCQELGFDMSEVAHVGDDLNDVPLLESVGLPLTVKDATEAAIKASYLVTEKPGGEGAVREVCDMILYSKSNEK
ncbi:MAG: HAD-IIIA family hydrolase [Pseudomonadota bacterium]|nr:HAD-IIIA family hydrolase [Pseudomonadota bacterium]